jgi:hypothetical protein
LNLGEIDVAPFRFGHDFLRYHENVAIRRRKGVALAGGDQQAGKVVARPDHGNVENWGQCDRHRCRAYISATMTAAANRAWSAARAAISVRILSGISIMTRRDRRRRPGIRARGQPQRRTPTETV